MYDRGTHGMLREEELVVVKTGKAGGLKIPYCQGIIKRCDDGPKEKYTEDNKRRNHEPERILPYNISVV
ncbi:MAG: hypothetical protein J6D53_13390, partial [Blautia sp.]|nr:hypothetical protein [Blautia sp.]